MIKFCIACRVEFVPDNKHSYQKYCSGKCRDDVNNKNKVISGKKKIYDATYREKHIKAKLFRDREYKDRVRFFDGRDSKSLNRKATLERDGFSCRMCGQLEYKKLIVHHNTYPADVDNLVTLCRSCHMKVHINMSGIFYPARNTGQQAQVV